MEIIIRELLRAYANQRGTQITYEFNGKTYVVK